MIGSIENVTEESLRDTMKKINALEGEELDEFNHSFICNIYNMSWCNDKRMCYHYPNFMKAKEETYRELINYGLIEES
ncbi:hypothetical protein KAI32_00605 [Candidatus Pacearchaeota archaeon]|nr:hypothetical protein [Candidatus Pacearchaeota archaeon]